jgi:hypothetical protein
MTVKALILELANLPLYSQVLTWNNDELTVVNKSDLYITEVGIFDKDIGGCIECLPKEVEAKETVLIIT